MQKKIIIPLISFGKQGGFRVLSELANNWIRAGYEVTFLAYKRSEMPYFPTIAKIIWYDGNGLHDKNDVALKKPILRLFAILYYLTKAINAINYDIVLANQCLTALPVRIAKEKGEKFYYIQAYETDFYRAPGYKNWILRLLSEVSYKLNLNRIVNSPLYFNYKGIKANKYVYPGIDFNLFSPTNSQKKITPFILGCIGRIEPFKGTSYVLEAFKELRQEMGAGIELHVAFGNEDLKLIEGVTIPNISGDAELSKYYKSVNVIIAPGTIQLRSVHYPVIEAMACKTPVITTGYLPADVNNAWIVPVKDSKAILSAIKEIMENPLEVKRKTEIAYLSIQEFGWNTVSEKMLKYFESNS